MKIDYQQWHQDDFPQIRDVVWRTWMVTYSSFIPQEDLRSFFDQHYSNETLSRQHTGKDIATFVAEIDKNVVAFERTFFNRDENRYYVASLYVLPESQGLGLGKQLMHMAAQEARKRKLDRVWLGVMVQNTQAVDWYRKLGYHIVEEVPFVMGKTAVEHFVGYLPISSIDAAVAKVPTSAPHP